jgi:Leucine-rich repeat (LRR) protein
VIVEAAQLVNHVLLSGDLQVVDCSRNKLRELPQLMLQAMPRLVVLNMSYNGLKSLPAGLAMASLSVLDLSFNKLAQLPAELGEQMPGLQQLYLANNYLKQLPESLGQVVGLQDLFLSENGFEEVPKVRWMTANAAIKADLCLACNKLHLGQLLCCKA